MTEPDLTTKQGRKAWKHDLRMVAVRPRRVGLALLAAAILLGAMPFGGMHSLWGWSPRFLALCAVALAVPFLFVATLLRRRYKRQIMNAGGVDRA